MPQVTLKFPEPGDAQRLLEAVRESLPELQQWMSWCHPGNSEADALQWITSQAHEAGTAFEFLIVGDRSRIFGVCGVNGIDTANRLANLGYWVRTSETRRGIAVQAVKLLAS